MVGGRGVFLWRVELCDLELSWGSIYLGGRAYFSDHRCVCNLYLVKNFLKGNYMYLNEVQNNFSRSF